ncbi:MAG: acyl-CoA/acyl-ACP dehydrogenase [Betaproteobacteria bacterium]|jgi:alkylation response protein AidB-like acyl-CoA dehydrogenase|nr:acyl-CoA/acyl-ACP dehydrogenase [Betaproteobacteria bacterium]MDH5341312.1 acyl-CoA/acyl-ACP dehydrogenase [Betaproteobacteria bacterium]
MSAPNENDHTALLAQSVGDFVQHGADLPRVRALAQTRAEFDRAQWQQLAELGWLGVLVPEDCGGLGLGLAEAAIVAEGIGRALTPEPYTAVAVLAARVLEQSADSALRNELLRGLVGGEQVPVVAWQEQPDDFAGLQVATTATPFEGGYRVSGEKQFVGGAAGANGYLVTAQSPDGLQLMWVPRDAAGCATGLVPLADGRNYGAVTLQDVAVPRENVLASGAAARAALSCALDHAAAVASAELVGMMKRTHEMSLDYLKTRVQFGKAIGSFQVLQHRTVDLHIQQELADAVLSEVVAQLDLAPDAVTRALAASRAKSRCADAALAITRAAIQFHGAIGFTEDCDVGLYVKRAMTVAAWLGNGRAHRVRYAALAAQSQREAA